MFHFRWVEGWPGVCSVPVWTQCLLCGEATWVGSSTVLHCPLLDITSFVTYMYVYTVAQFLEHLVLAGNKCWLSGSSLVHVVIQMALTDAVLVVEASGPSLIPSEYTLFTFLFLLLRPSHITRMWNLILTLIISEMYNADLVPVHTCNRKLWTWYFECLTCTLLHSWI